MKLFLTSLVTAAALTISAALPTSAQDDTKPDTYAECLQRCLDQYLENLEACHDSCWVCDVWILFCVSGHVDSKCFSDCSAAAKQVHEACKRECRPSS